MTAEGEELLEVIARALNVDRARIDEGASGKTVKEWDSLGHLQVCLAVQERFGIVMDLDTIARTGSVAALREALRAAKA